MTQYWLIVVPRIRNGTVERWAVYAHGIDNARRLLETKREAVEFAKQKSRNSYQGNNPGVVIHDKNGWPRKVWVNPGYTKGTTPTRGLPRRPPWERRIDHL